MVKRIGIVIILFQFISCNRESPPETKYECFLLDENKTWLSAFPDSNRYVNLYTQNGLTDRMKVSNHHSTGSIKNVAKKKMYIEERYQFHYTDFFDLDLSTSVRCWIDSVVFDGIIYMNDHSGKRMYAKFHNNLKTDQIIFMLENSYWKTEAWMLCDTCWTDYKPITIGSHFYSDVIKLSNPLAAYGDTFAITTVFISKKYGAISLLQKNGLQWYIENY